MFVPPFSVIVNVFMNSKYLLFLKSRHFLLGTGAIKKWAQALESNTKNDTSQPSWPLSHGKQIDNPSAHQKMEGTADSDAVL